MRAMHSLIHWCGFTLSSLGSDWWPASPALSLLLSLHAASLWLFPPEQSVPYLCLSLGGWVSAPAGGEALQAALRSAQGWWGTLVLGGIRGGSYLHPQGGNFLNGTSWHVGIAAGCASCSERELGMSSRDEGRALLPALWSGCESVHLCWSQFLQGHLCSHWAVKKWVRIPACIYLSQLWRTIQCLWTAMPM